MFVRRLRGDNLIILQGAEDRSDDELELGGGESSVEVETGATGEC